jgi:hypothetical protein
MPDSNYASRSALKSDLARVDAHRIKESEYEELPEHTEEMMARATINKGGPAPAVSPRTQLTLRLPADVKEIQDAWNHHFGG